MIMKISGSLGRIMMVWMVGVTTVDDNYDGWWVDRL